VAVKILNKARIKETNMEAKVSREIKIMRLFHHPHVLNLYEVYETPTEIFLFIEYAERGELFTYIVKRKTIDVDEARRYFQQLISAINYCHKRVAVLHRDIKPENLLLARGNNLKLSDFGLSNMLSEGEFLKTSCGSPNYASSEIVAGSEYVGPPADIWSCGCVLYTLLVGRLPFDDPYVPSLFRKIKTGEYTIPSWVDPLAADLIRGMLCVNVDRRLTVEQIKVHPWFQKNLPRYLRVNFDLDLSEIDEEIRMSKLGDDIAARMTELHYSLPDVLRDMKGGIINDGVVSYKLILGTVYDEVLGVISTDNPAGGPAQGQIAPTSLGSLAAAQGISCQGVNLALDSNLFGAALLAPDNAHEFSGVHYDMYANKLEESSVSNEERRRQREERRQKNSFYFGVKLCEVSSRYPYEVMLSMIDTVRRLGFRWRVGGFIATRYYDRSQGADKVTLKLDNSKVKNPYTLTIKCASPMNQFENELIIGLTLYTAYDQRSCSYYMVDMRKVMGEVAFFLYTAQSLGAALAEALE